MTKEEFLVEIDWIYSKYWPFDSEQDSGNFLDCVGWLTCYYKGDVYLKDWWKRDLS